MFSCKLGSGKLIFFFKMYTVYYKDYWLSGDLLLGQDFVINPRQESKFHTDVLVQLSFPNKQCLIHKTGCVCDSTITF